ncbi:unnamed protein product [Parnassius apollo]|uniref:(apollo) hypothetical protein n=1 Tax=Parnassius apollo TaxID=110799 RepID=A0A8S3XJ82_PARAO|nr:unnamed protein product [Parnassius apollo]
MVNCAVYLCKRRSTSSNLREHSVSYHLFPKDPVLKEVWRKFCNRKNKWFPKRTSVVCSDHFSPSCFQVLNTNKRRILFEGVIPTVRSGYCSRNNQQQKEKTVLSPSKCKNVNYEQPLSEFMETSTVTKIKDKLRNKSKNVKRLQTRNRFSKHNMDGLNELVITLSTKSLSGKKGRDVVDESCASKNSLERSNRMSIKQDETVVSNEFGLPECRTCLQPLDANSVLVDLFQCWVPPWDGMESTIAEDLAKLANIQITQSDRYSKVICEPCCLKLQSACDFACSVRKKDRLLRQRFPTTPEKMENCNKTVWPKPIQLDKNINGSVYGNVMDVEIKQEVLSEDEYISHNALEECREAELANLEIKIEPEEIIQQQPMQIEEHVKTITEQTQSYNTILNGHLHDSKDNVIGLTNGIDSKTDIPKVKEEPVSDEDDGETIPTDLSLECMLCSKEFNSVSGLKAHVIAQHSYKTVRRKTDKNSPEQRLKNHGFICGTCQRKFKTSTDLMVHETCHNKSVCYACSAKFDTFEQLTRHSRRCKAIVNKEVLKPKTLEDVKRPIFQDLLRVISTEKKPTKKMLKCSKCNEKFSDEYYMKIHEEIHHSVNSQTVKNKGGAISDIKTTTNNRKSIFGRSNLP